MQQETCKYNVFDEKMIGFSGPISDNVLGNITKICQECDTDVPDYRCNTCKTLLCTACFTKIHSIKTLQNHSKTLLSDVGSLITNKELPSASGLIIKSETYYIPSIQELSKKYEYKRNQIESSLLEANKIRIGLKADVESIRKMNQEFCEYFDRLQESISHVKNSVLKRLQKIEHSAEQSFKDCEERLRQLSKDLQTTLEELKSALTNNDPEFPKIAKNFLILLEEQDTICLTHPVQIQSVPPPRTQWIDEMEMYFNNYNFGHGGKFSVLHNPNSNSARAEKGWSRESSGSLYSGVEVLSSHSFILSDRSEETASNTSIQSVSKQRQKDLIKNLNSVKKKSHLKNKTNRRPILNNEIYKSKKNSNVDYHPTSQTTETTSNKLFHKLDEGRFYKHVLICHINSPSDFWVQLPYGRKILDEYKKVFTAASDWPTVEEVDTDSVYLTNKDDCWYRVKVLEILELSKVHVCMIDFGWKDVISPSSLRRIKVAEIQAAPPIAFNCRLFDCYPNDSPDWSENVIDSFKNIVGNSPMKMYIFSKHLDKKLEVDFWKTEDRMEISIRDVLVSSDRAQYLPAEQPVPMMMKPIPMYKYRKDTDFTQNEKVLVRVSHVENPDEFYVQRVGDIASKKIYDKLGEELTDFFRSSNNYKEHYIRTVVEGMVVAAQYNEDNRWYRAEVIKVGTKKDNKRCEIHYVDFGNRESLNRCRIRMLPEVFTHMVVQAMRCSLNDIVPLKKDWNISDAKFFANLVRHEDLDMIVHNTNDDVLQVSLLKKNDANSNEVICINEVLVKQGIARGIRTNAGIQSLVAAVPKNKSSKTREDESSTRSESESDIVDSPSVEESSIQCVDLTSETMEKSKKKYNVTVLSCINPNTIYLQLAEQRNQTLELSFQMAKYYRDEKNNEDTILESVEDGLKCAVYKEIDKKWCRAKVLAVLSDTEVKVFLSDYAEEEVVSLNNIRRLCDDFMKMVDGCIRCTLEGFESKQDWLSNEREKLKSLIESHREFQMEVKARCDNALLVNLMGKAVTCEGPLEPTKVKWVDIGAELKEPNRPTDLKKVYKPPLETNLKKLALTTSKKNSVDTVREWLATSVAEASMKGVVYSCHLPETTTSEVKTMLPDSTTPISDIDDGEMSTNENHRDWLPPVPLKETTFLCTPTYVDFDMGIYVQVKDTENTALKMIHTRLQQKYKNKEPSTYRNWRVGQMCISLFKTDNQWYRGRVLRVDLVRGKLLVMYVDYGNIDFVDPSNVHEVIACPNIPIQCHKLKIRSDCVPVNVGDWPLDILEYIQSSMADLLCRAELIKEDGENFYRIYNLTIIKTNISVYDLLLGLGACTSISFNGNMNAITEEDDNDSNFIQSDSSIDDVEKMSNSQVISLRELNEKTLIYFTISNIKQETDDQKLQISEIQPPITGGKIVAQITEILTPDVVAINILECETNMEVIETRREFEMMEAELQTDAIKQPLIKYPFEGRVCCTTFYGDNKWYRVIVIWKCDHNEYAVYYLDYGNAEKVHLSKLHQLKPQWYDIPAQAIKCHLETDDSCSVTSNEKLDIMADMLNCRYDAIIRENDNMTNKNLVKYSLQVMG